MTIVRRIIPILFLLWLVSGPSLAAPSDSLKVRWINGQKYLLHKVLPKETWTSVSKKYDISISELQKANPGVEVLKISQIINIPASSNTAAASGGSKPAADPKPAPKAASTSSPAKYHTVTKGETLYRIAKDNGITVQELQDMNGLTSTNVSVGKKLKVSEGKTVAASSPATTTSTTNTNTASTPNNGTIEREWIPTEPAKKESVKSETPKADTAEKPKSAPQISVPVTTENVPTTPGTSTGSKTEMTAVTTPGQKITENGVATWIADSEMNQNKFYALHRTAPVGTIIRLTNRMNNNSVYVKVIGVLPSTGDNENVLIKITQAAAQRIGALDQRFQAELSYAAE
jgi:LysM repeat protein